VQPPSDPDAPATHDVTAAVHALLRAGLPPRDEPLLDDLLALRAVTARATDPADHASRLRALDGWLRWALARLGHPRLAEGARLLFGAAPGAAGLTLTERRAKAAAAAGYEAHHFRKRIEPRIVARLAAVLAADDAETADSAAAPRLARARRPLRLPADVFAWEAAEHEQSLAQLWAEVYALRAALLAVARLAGMHGAEHPETGAATAHALWRAALLHARVLTYRETYGPQLLGAAPGTDPGELAAFAGWQPPLDPHVLGELADLAAAHPDPGDFQHALSELAVEAADAWRRALAQASAIPSREQEPWI
jgi:hypothetical protein